MGYLECVRFGLVIIGRIGWSGSKWVSQRRLGLGLVLELCGFGGFVDSDGLKRFMGFCGLGKYVGLIGLWGGNVGFVWEKCMVLCGVGERLYGPISEGGVVRDAED